MRGSVFTKWLSKLRRLDFAAGWFFIGFVAGIAQLVEHLICNQAVVGSNPTAGLLSINDLHRTSKVAPA